MIDIQKTKIILFAVLVAAIFFMPTNSDATNSDATKDNNDSTHQIDYSTKSNFIEKDHTEDRKESAEILDELISFLIVDISNSTSTNIVPPNSNFHVDKMKINELVEREREMQEINDDYKKAENIYRSKILDERQREKINLGYQHLENKNIPIKMMAEGIDHLHIQLEKENQRYEELIIKILDEIQVPYKIEYTEVGEGFELTACNSAVDCDIEVGGLTAQTNYSIFKIEGWFDEGIRANCTITPVLRYGIEGFLTADHCFFSNGDLQQMYRPLYGNENIGYTNSTWRGNVQCDCAWVIDTSNTPQYGFVLLGKNLLLKIDGIKTPQIGDKVIPRGASSAPMYQVQNDGKMHVKSYDV